MVEWEEESRWWSGRKRVGGGVGGGVEGDGGVGGRE